MTERLGERGSVAVEVAVLAPAFVALLLLVVFAGRVAHADAQVQRASSEAARAASLRQSPFTASDAAADTAASNLLASGFICRDLATDVDTTAFRPGGTVTVTVRCVIDRYRGGE
jgi:Flp pilus assembly protein TadG